jgi:hypothetical protein
MFVTNYVLFNCCWRAISAMVTAILNSNFPEAKIIYSLLTFSMIWLERQYHLVKVYAWYKLCSFIQCVSFLCSDLFIYFILFLNVFNIHPFGFMWRVSMFVCPCPMFLKWLAKLESVFCLNVLMCLV